MSAALWLLALALALPQEGAPPAGLVVAGPEKPVLLGEPFSVLVRAPGGLADVQLAPSGAGDAAGETLRPGEIERRRVGNEVEFRVPLQAVREGELTVALLARLEDGSEVPLPPVTVTARLDLPPDRLPRLSGRLPPLTLPVPSLASWPFAAAAVVWLAALGAWLVWTTREQRVAEPEVPADELARAALARLAAALPSSPEEMLPFTVAVGDVLREYVERRFGLAAPARTTEEFLAEAGRRQDAIGSRREHLQRFLLQCDLVKYARHRPDPSAAPELLDTVRRFVDETAAAGDEGGLTSAPPQGDAPRLGGAPLAPAASGGPAP